LLACLRHYSIGNLFVGGCNVYYVLYLFDDVGACVAVYLLADWPFIYWPIGRLFIIFFIHCVLIDHVLIDRYIDHVLIDRYID